MRICWLGTEFVVMDDVRDCLREMGHEIVSACDDKTDALLVMSISQLYEGQRQHASFPNVPMFNYCWDLYSWVWTRPRVPEYDYRGYGTLLQASREVWCPSECTSRAVNLFYGPKVKTREIRTAITKWEPDDIADDGYILQPIREQPDALWGWCEKLCEKNNLTIVCSDHRLDFESYKKIVAHCSFIVSPLWELSTGGLTLLEGHRLGKPVLMMDSPWHGGRDYFYGSRGGVIYATPQTFEKTMCGMALHRPLVDATKAREWVDGTFTTQRMADEITNRVEAMV